MEYKRFIVNAFEKEPGKWRACVQRPNGNPLQAKSRTRLDQFITATDAASADAALMMAIQAIDAGSFARTTTRSTEKFWRRTGAPRRADRA